MSSSTYVTKEIVLNIALDLGSDTLKIAFAYVDAKGVTRFGKIAPNNMATRAAIPAVAYYDEGSRKWVFGNEVGRRDVKSFANVVKIKSLLSLCDSVDAADLPRGVDRNVVMQKNQTYYHDRNEFPRFAFPRRYNGKDFERLYLDRQTFNAAPFTPRDVCAGFFRYAADLTKKRVNDLEKALGVTVAKKRIILVYPPKTRPTYIEEYETLVKEAFKTRPEQKLNSIKALTMYAKHRGSIMPGDTFLIFDMGEEDISVAKAALIWNSSTREESLAVDGADGHNPPRDIGGNDIDEAVAKYFDGYAAVSETPGTPSYGQEGHIVEQTLDSKQYLFLKSIKDAKVLLGLLGSDEAYAPVQLERALVMHGRLTGKEFRECVGCVADGVRRGSVAEQMVGYILEELRRPMNGNVGKIILAGGVTETYGMTDYIRSVIKGAAPSVKVMTLETKGGAASDAFVITSDEDSVYSAAVGAAILLATGYKLKTVLSLSYGTWVVAGENDSTKILKIFASKGEEVKELYLSGWIAAGREGETYSTIPKEEIFSVPLTQEDMRIMQSAGNSRAFMCRGGNPVMIVGEPDSAERAEAIKAGLKTEGGGKGTTIIFEYKGKAILVPGSLAFCEGIRVDSDGRAQAVIGTAASFQEYAKTRANTQHKVVVQQTRTALNVYEKDITVRFGGEGINDFSVGMGD